MNMKKVSITLLVAALVLSISTLTFCSGILNPEKYGGTSSDTSTKIQTQSGQIIGIVQVVAMAIAVIMLIWLAIKYISAAPSEKADIKKSAIIYIVGAVLLFATTGILGIIRTFAGGLTGEAGSNKEIIKPSEIESWDNGMRRPS